MNAAGTSDERMQRDIGHIEARQDSMDERLVRMEKKLDSLMESMSTARGGLRVLIAVGSITAAISAAVVEILHYIHSPQ